MIFRIRNALEIRGTVLLTSNVVGRVFVNVFKNSLSEIVRSNFAYAGCHEMCDSRIRTSPVRDHQFSGIF